jgi:hypothetical protein
MTIPKNVTSIGDHALYVSYNRIYLTINMESEIPPTIGTYLINNNGYTRFEVPTAEAYEAYIAATNWSGYANRISYNQEV